MLFLLALGVLSPLAAASPTDAPGTELQEQLLREAPPALAEEAMRVGDAARGAIVFYRPELTCTRCHAAGEGASPLGPDLAEPGEEVTGAYLAESLLRPSKVIKKGYEAVVVVTTEGRTVSGLVAEDGPDRLVLRDPEAAGKLTTLAVAEIEERSKSAVSVMPERLVNQLADRREFLDLLRYLIEIAEHGPARARQLRPAAALYATRPLPEYESDLDHAGIIRDWDDASFERGQAIYNRLCINCHGTRERAGSLPTSLRFASGKFKNGSDPYGMYRTLTHGYGMMVAQAWMVPRQKYDVIHYIREAYVRESNPSQYVAVDDAYLAGLPKGTTRGPEPIESEPWVDMDYGPSLIATYEIGRDETNFAYKGIAVRLDAGPGGVSRGRYWTVFDHDTLRMGGAWSGEQFIDYAGIMFNGEHVVHPHVVGQVHLANPIGPGWGNPEDGSFDDPRLRGRDGKPYGPLPRAWAHYRGLYHFGNQAIVSYTVGDTSVLEMPGLYTPSDVPVFTRLFNIGPRKRPMTLQVARRPGATAELNQISSPHQGGGGDGGSPNALSATMYSLLAPKSASVEVGAGPPTIFNGDAYCEVARPDDFDLATADFTISARIRTRRGGTLFAKTAPTGNWVPDGKALFVRRGKLVFDIGWVGAVESRRPVNDGRWHDVALVWEHRSGRVRLYVDGRLDGQGRLKPRGAADGQVVRIGFGAPDFPKPESFFQGQMERVRFYARALDEKAISEDRTKPSGAGDGLARWDFAELHDSLFADASGNEHHARLVKAPSLFNYETYLVAGATPLGEQAQWLATDDGSLRLHIPAGEAPLRFTVWAASVENRDDVAPLLGSLDLAGAAMDLAPLTHGGPPRWPERIAAQATIGSDDGPFAVDDLAYPAENPWLCRVRTTGFDFLPGGDTAAVCTWDGDVWLARGIDRPEEGITWQRIASGLFQPLGLKVVKGNIYVTCRDQIVILRDLNGDGETDFYENFNNDHQVTEHFHEFAMGLQTDAAGNFYYAKSARHAKKAIVPHHGTLLRVSADGTRTDIIATGFRAANGVCINSDGTFIVTDQEGHWNPKNRINWVKPGGFYGNMWGYHDVTDTSDATMEQPVCWITNSFDRSPSELVRVESDAWGPLEGALLNFSYGYGKVYVVPYEFVDGQPQGGMCELPIPQFPTGIMRGRFHPQSGQLYTCGMFAWAGNQQQPGGFYRVRYTGKPLHVPVGLEARHDGIVITFTGKLDRETANDPTNYAVKIWSLKRTANYGSEHYNERSLAVTAATLSADATSVALQIPEIIPTWCMEIKYSLTTSGGAPLRGTIHNTIHHVAPEGATPPPPAQ